MFIENIIYFVLGFLFSSLLGIFIMPSIWKRAVRLTKKRYEMANPITMAEFLAEKDQLRAQFALSTRKLEMQIEKLRQKLSEQLAQLNENKSELALMNVELDSQMMIAEELEIKNEKLNKRVAELEKNKADISQKLRMKERELESEKQKYKKHISQLERKISALERQLINREKELEEVNSPILAERHIAHANSILDELVQQTNDNTDHISENNKRSLVHDLAYEEEIKKLHNKINEIKASISQKWGKEKNIDKNLSKDLAQVANIAMSIEEIEQAKTPSKPNESLLAKVQKFVKSENLDEEIPTTSKQIKNLSASTISKRFKVFQKAKQREL